MKAYRPPRGERSDSYPSRDNELFFAWYWTNSSWDKGVLYLVGPGRRAVDDDWYVDWDGDREVDVEKDVG